MLLLLLQPTLLSCMALILCLLTGTILFSFSPVVNYSRRLLACSYFIMTGSFLVGLLVMFDEPPVDIRWLKLPHFIWLLNIPLPYLYARSLTRARWLSRKDLIHLLPCILFMVDSLPVFMGHSTLSITPAMGWQRVHEIVPHEQGLLFPPDFHVPVTALTMTLYWILQVHQLVIYSEQQPPPGRSWVRWLSIYTFLQSLMFLPTLISLIINRPNDWVSVIPTAVGAMLSCITLLLCPDILYGNSLIKLSKEDPPRSRPIFDEASVETLTNRLTRYMTDKKPFLKGDYSLQELAQALDMPPHKLSSFINTVTGKNFNEYLNQQRIAYCLDLIAGNELNHLNINGLAALCGFNNRNTFSIAFKKVTGSSPSDYLRKMQPQKPPCDQ